MIPNPMGNINPEDEGGSENETTLHPTNNDKPKKQRNPRATRLEMERREKSILKMLKSTEELDAYGISKALKISYAQVGTVLTSLAESGKIERAGIRSRRVVYRLPVNKQIKVAKETKPVLVKEAAPVGIPLHLGEKLEVTEIHMTKEGIRIEVRDQNETFLLALVS